MISLASMDRYVDELPGLTTTAAVLNSLHALVHPTLSVYSAWRYPIYPGDNGRWREGKNVFFHSNVPTAYRAEFWPLVLKYGSSPVAMRAMQRKSLLLWSEARPVLALRGQESWLFDLARKHGRHDGVYCPSAPWMVGYWTPNVLRGRYKLDGKIRKGLFIAGNYAAGRLEELIEPEKIDGKVPKLTARQSEVVRLIADGRSNVEIAKTLGVSIDTVSDVTAAAKKNLGARSRCHTAIMALRLHLIA